MSDNAPAAGTPGKTVLIVDDESRIRRFVRGICMRLGAAECVEAENTGDALALLEKRSFDLVISDLNMPGESGIKVVERVKSGGSGTPVLIFSGSLVGDEKTKLMHAGADAVLPKTADVVQIMTTIQKLLARR